MTNIKDVLQKLSEYFDSSLTFDEIIDKDENKELENLYIIRHANQSELSNVFIELCTEYRMIRDTDVIAVHVETWNEFSKFINPESFSVFFYTLIANANSTRFPKCKSIALLAARCYCLCQTSPGSKAFGFFNETIVEKCFGLLKMLELCRNPTALKGNERLELQIHCMTFLEDIEILLGIVSLDDYVDLKQALVENVSIVLQLYFENYLRGAPGIEDKCCKVLENFLLPVQGDIEANLMVILNGTLHLNKFHKPSAPSSQQKFDSITCWFIALLDKYPNQTCSVLSAFIQYVLTVPALSADKDRDRNIDICVQYDSAMYSKCNKSMVDYLKELACSSDVSDRESCVEMVGKMLLVDSPVCSWSTTTTSADVIPREIDLMSMLITKLLDISNRIKVQSVNLFVKVTGNDGNEMCKKILKTFQPNDNVDGDEAEQLINVSGIEELNDLPNRLFEISQWNMKNVSASVRRSALILLEYVVKISLDIEEFISSPAFEKMVEDLSLTVRRQLVSTIDKILGLKPNDLSICKTYIKTMLFLANDSDPKIVDAVIDSLRKYIFDNIDKYEATVSDKQLFPWQLLRLIIASGEDSLDLRKCIDKSINRKLMTATTLSYVETYLDSPYALDAYILLSMVASTIKSKTPEVVYMKLQDNLHDFANEAPTKAFYQLDVIQKWFDDLPKTTQLDLFSKFTALLKTGTVSPLHVKRIYEMCCKYVQRTGELESWTNDLNTSCENYIQNEKLELMSNSYAHKLINYIVIYSETIDESSKINRDITNFLFNFIKIEVPKKISVDPHLVQKVNTIQIVLTRLAFRDDDILTKCVPMLATILKTKGLSHSVFETGIKCLGDLCKKYTQLVESVISSVLLKTQSQSDQVRKCAIETLASLVLEDYLKFRGSILLFVLAATADIKYNIARLAHELMIKFANEKNPILIRSCLKECPFAFSDCKLVDNSEVFGSDLCLRSPLKSKQASRQYIYRFLVHNLEIIDCYMYFDHFCAIKDRVTSKNFQKSTAFLQSIQDFLYICEHICKVKEVPKSKSAENADESQLVDEENDTLPTAAAVPQANVSTANKRKKQETTLPQAMVVIEKAISVFPTLNTTLIELDSKFKTPFEQLCSAIGQHFGDSIKYVPTSFWNKYQKSRSAKKMLRRNENADDDSDGNDDIVSASTSKNLNTEHREQISPRKAIKRMVIDDDSSDEDFETNKGDKAKLSAIQPTKSQKSTNRQANQRPKTPISSQEEKRQISARKAVKTMVIEDDSSDEDFQISKGDQVMQPAIQPTKSQKPTNRQANQRPKTPISSREEKRQISARKAVKTMVIEDDSSDEDFQISKGDQVMQPAIQPTKSQKSTNRQANQRPKTPISSQEDKRQISARKAVKTMVIEDDSSDDDCQISKGDHVMEPAFQPTKSPKVTNRQSNQRFISPKSGQEEKRLNIRKPRH